MRFNELIAGVRGDVAVKVFGDEFEPMLRAANQIAAILRGVQRRRGRQGRAGEGLPVLDIKVDKAAIARRGLSVAAVQDVIGAAIGGREAGMVFEGDRRFEIVVRLPESVRADLEALSNLPVPLPTGDAGSRGAERAARTAWRRSASPKGRTRSAARTASAASWSRPTCAAATSARSSPRRSSADRRAR